VGADAKQTRPERAVAVLVATTVKFNMSNNAFVKNWKKTKALFINGFIGFIL
jgi:hypothetical protein